MKRLAALCVVVLVGSLTPAAANFCLFNSQVFSRLRGKSDAWLDDYEVVRVVTSALHYLPSYLAEHGEAYGTVSGNATLKTLAKSGCKPNAMSASGVFQLATPPGSFAQGESRFNSHLHEGTCAEISNSGESTNGLGNHYQHIPRKITCYLFVCVYVFSPAPSDTMHIIVCPRYSYQNYDNSPGCLNSEAPGGVTWRKPVFELWPTFFPENGATGVWKVGALSEQASDLTECPTPCSWSSCTECQARAVPWWPVPGTAVSIVVHDTARVTSGSGPVMLCADITGKAVEKEACVNAGVVGCKEAALKSESFCSFSDNAPLAAGETIACVAN